MKAWIGLGGNFAQSKCLIVLALAALDEHESVRILRRSEIYRSPPWGVSDQADFVNAVAEVETSLAADRLLGVLLDTENRLGRERPGLRWGPRCIDLDLLTYHDQVLDTRSLKLPHPRMHLRAFVLKPILELEPGFEIPGIGKAQTALARLEPDEVSAVQPIGNRKQET